MKQVISSKSNFNFYNARELYTSPDSKFLKKRAPFLRYAKMLSPLSLSMWCVRDDGGFYLLADRDGARYTSWTPENLEQFDTIAPLKKRYHSHDFFELVYVLEGEVNEWIEDQCIRLEAGDFILLDKNIRHVEEYIQSKKTAGCVFLAMDDECVKTMAESERPYENPQSILRFLLNNLNSENTTSKSYYHFRSLSSKEFTPSEAENEMNAILSELADKKPGFILMIQGHLRRLFGILENPKKYEQLSSCSTLDQKEDIIAQINLLMEASMGLMDKRELAEQMNYNAAYLCRIIKESLGKSFTQYRLSFRLEAAKELLINSNLSITEICDKLLFTNRTYFYRAFESSVGMTPQQFREKYK